MIQLAVSQDFWKVLTETTRIRFDFSLCFSIVCATYPIKQQRVIYDTSLGRVLSKEDFYPIRSLVAWYQGGTLDIGRRHMQQPWICKFVLCTPKPTFRHFGRHHLIVSAVRSSPHCGLSSAGDRSMRPFFVSSTPVLVGCLLLRQFHLFYS